MGTLYTTRQAAKKAHLALVTIQRWIADRKLKAPRLVVRQGRAVRLWTEADVKKILRFKAANYRKGRGRKKKPKV
jgi:hypothetical protein